MSAIARPMNRTERRAAAHKARKATSKAQRAIHQATAAVAKGTEFTRAAITTVNASVDQPLSEPLNIPSVDSYKGGPRTESGKQTSSQNAVKHGGCSLSILINPQESIEDFLALEKRWFQSYKVDPNNKSIAEADLIKAAVRAEWFYLRAERNFAEYDNHLGICHQSPATWAEDEHKTYARFLRYRTANLNILNKSRKAIEDYRKNRLQEAAKAQAMDHAKEKLEIAKTKLAIYQENHEPDVPLDQMLDNMRKKAVRLGFRPDND